jgi:uncharacterized protein (DUF934 family)
MPRRLLREGRIVDDEWLYVAETASYAVPALIVPFDQWLSARDSWIASGARLGVLLSPVHKVANVVPDLARFELIAAEFTGPGEGRGYSQARLLRERWNFTGELRATGHVRLDQVFFLERCGFNSFEMSETDIEAAHAAPAPFSAAYQASNDAGLALKLRHR